MKASTKTLMRISPKIDGILFLVLILISQVVRVTTSLFTDYLWMTTLVFVLIFLILSLSLKKLLK
ncbi:hypothetical protein DFP96_102116 [Listeria rocourtiae]|uniref:Uncharacterized protein n=1 Tax=Listeria rocourtiae TaxID=647910 RepID=A0A4R6ZPP1_9LIST|nr:hypothetical protein PROCOU_12103 [Listeria rocourtiae FSL F6-920]TDR54530.1 hypothetical protein DFP96_102116 [Listeria rocourtiae]